MAARAAPAFYGARYAAEARGGALARSALLAGVVVDGYADLWRLRGADAAPRLPQLRVLLARYHLPAAAAATAAVAAGGGGARGSEVAAAFACAEPL